MSKIIKKMVCLCLVCLFIITLSSCQTESKKKITIIQYVSASALDDACAGIIEGLEAAGFVDGENVEIEVKNPQAEANTLSLMVQTAVRESDMIIAIATPVALAVKSECEKIKSDIPVLFTAVTDPVASGIVASNEEPGANISGTNDMNPVVEQVKLLKELDPNAKKLGVLYTSSEPNSLIQVELAKEAAAELGIEIVTQSIATLNDVKTMATALVSKDVDAVYLPTDNNIASAISAVTSVTNEAGIPTICGEEGMLNGGGIITLGINYKNLGKITGDMAARVLKGEDISKMSVEGLKNFTLVINRKQAQESGITIPEELLSKADVIVE